MVNQAWVDEPYLPSSGAWLAGSRSSYIDDMRVAGHKQVQALEERLNLGLEPAPSPSRARKKS